MGKNDPKEEEENSSEEKIQKKKKKTVGKAKHVQPKLRYRTFITRICNKNHWPTPDKDAHQVLQLALDHVFDRIMDHCKTRLPARARFNHYYAQNGVAAYLTSCDVTPDVIKGATKFVDGLLSNLK